MEEFGDNQLFTVTIPNDVKDGERLYIKRPDKYAYIEFTPDAKMIGKKIYFKRGPLAVRVFENKPPGAGAGDLPKGVIITQAKLEAVEAAERLVAELEKEVQQQGQRLTFWQQNEAKLKEEEKALAEALAVPLKRGGAKKKSKKKKSKKKKSKKRRKRRI
tara:strand:- start:1639 stop:2118 length:480 start_codon:yes stop_codon:yes gene_type:complete